MTNETNQKTGKVAIGVLYILGIRTIIRHVVKNDCEYEDSQNKKGGKKL